MKRPGPASARHGARRWAGISRPRHCSTFPAWSTRARRSKSKSRRSCRPDSSNRFKDKQMTQRSTSADFVTAFATGWPENQPDVLILSLTTSKGMHDFALNKEQALLIAKTMKETAAQLGKPKPRA